MIEWACKHLTWVRTPSYGTRSTACQPNLDGFKIALTPTPAVPYWKVYSAGLGYFAEAAAIGCCEAILVSCIVSCLV